MIYTVTLNPSLDYVTESSIEKNCLNRSKREEYFAGGKGINVSLMLKNLGMESKALGFLAGFTGNETERILNEKGVGNNFIYLDEGFTRINVKIKNTEGETEINACGPYIKKPYIDMLLDLIGCMKKTDIIVMSGSEPKSDEESIYKAMAEKAFDCGIKFIADTTGKNLKEVIKYKPLLIKPNRKETEEYFGKKAESREEIINMALKLQKEGAERVIVSDGAEGAVFIGKEGKIYCTKAPEGKVINTVGSGDSMIAGYIYGMVRHKDEREAFKLAVSAGSATAFSKGIGEKEKVYEIYKSIKLQGVVL